MDAWSGQAQVIGNIYTETRYSGMRMRQINDTGRLDYVRNLEIICQFAIIVVFIALKYFHLFNYLI